MEALDVSTVFDAFADISISWDITSDHRWLLHTASKSFSRRPFPSLYTIIRESYRPLHFSLKEMENRLGNTVIL